MILMVPYSPEVPKHHAPRLWPPLLMLLTLGMVFLWSYDVLMSDQKYVDDLQVMIEVDEAGMPILKPEAHAYLQLRPLLTIAPSKGDWDMKRLIFANFLHGSIPHLLLNLIGVFAGVRICSTFLAFRIVLLLYLVGGSLGLLASMLLSSEVSMFIPHVGSSAGIFALMGTYYVFNFRYRTNYFFWFPTRHGMTALRTSWFFFLDVILLEIILSTAQLFPNRIDSVDHLAHVVGFISGVLMAIIVRSLARWPRFLQTRGEYCFWRSLRRAEDFDPIRSSFEAWVGLLRLNCYNDQLKVKLFETVTVHCDSFQEEQIEIAFRFMSPTFIRLHSKTCAELVRELLARNRPLPDRWLQKTPYDSIIRVAKHLTQPLEDQKLLVTLIVSYQTAHPEGGPVDRKMELLMNRLTGLVPQGHFPSPHALGQILRNGASKRPQKGSRKHSRSRRAKPA